MMDSAEIAQNRALAERLLSEQHFAVAISAGVVTMILAAGIYGIAKSLSGGVYYSMLAMILGVLIGLAMQYLGRGIESRFAIAASLCALGAGLFGNLFAVVMDLARDSGTAPLAVLTNTASGELYELTVAGLHFADWLFWIIGIGGAAYFSRRSLTREENLALYARRMGH